MILPALALLIGAAAQPPAHVPAGRVSLELIATPPPGDVGSQAPAPALPAADPPNTPSATQAAIAPATKPSQLAEVAPKTTKVVRRHHAPGDPLEGFNRSMFALHQRFDKALFRPAALGYRDVVPKPLRSGLRHAFSNLNEPIVFLNYLLQLKPGKAAETLGRFVVNSTIGVGGLVDVAKRHPFRLPHRPNGFGNTLGRYGVRPGPYLFLPLVGPSTLRDFVGAEADSLVLPGAIGTPFDRAEYQVPRAVVTGLDQRAEADDELRTLFDSAIDPYATLRSVYLQNRASEIAALRGKHAKSEQPPAELDDPLDDPDAAGSAEAVPATDSSAQASVAAPVPATEVQVPPAPIIEHPAITR